MQLLTLSAGLSQEHEMHDPDEGILAAFDSIAEASCVCAFFFFNCCVFCSSSLCFLPLFATQHTWWNPASLHDTGWWRAGSLESKGDSGIHHGEKVPSEKNNRKTCEELCHHTKNDMGKKVRKPEFPGTEWFCIPLDNNSTLNLDTRGLDQHVRVV